MSTETIALGSAEPPIAARLCTEHVSAFDLVLERERQRAFAAGQREALAGAALPLERAAAAVQDIADGAEPRLARSAAELALAIARSILVHEVEEGRYDLEAMVRQTLEDSEAERGACTVHLHPDDHARLSDVTFRSGTHLEPDPGVPRGEVQVETRLGLIVRSVEESLATVGERILGTLP